MADNKVKFWPIRGTEAQVLKQPYENGKLYFTTDTNKIYLDVNGTKHLMGGTGGAGSGIIYANGTEEQIVKKLPDIAEDFNYVMEMAALENPMVEPPIDGLILNSDGRFFRVLSVDSETHTLEVLLLAVSGSGGGGGGPTVADITLTYDADTINNNSTFIEGKSQYASFTAVSETDSIVYLQFSIYASWAEYNNGKGTYIKSFTRQAESGEPYLLNMAEFAAGSGMVLKVVATAPSSRTPEGAVKVLTGINIVAMSIRKYRENAFIGVTTHDSVAGLVLEYIPYGTGLTCNLHVSIDNNEIDIEKVLTPANMGSRQSVAIPEQSHGMHTVALWLGTELNNEELYSEKIEFEAAWSDGTSTVPIIWFGDYSDTIVQYENAVIPYMVYNPVTESNGLKTTVNFKKNNVIISTQEVQYGTSWLLFDATAFYDIGANNFAINCGVASQNISFVVTKEGARNLDLANPDALVMNFSSLGRSNSETATARKNWTSGTYSAIFNGFNWYNNGWRNDEDGEGSYLSIANDANLTIPFGTIGLNGTQDWTFEMRFRVRNIQKYSTLVTSVPLYKYYTTQEAFDTAQALIEAGEEPTGMNTDGSELSIDEMNTANGNTALRGPVYWLAYDIYGNPAMNERNTTRKTIETENGVAVKYLNNSNYGFCIGTQEAYFRTPSNVTNVRYKEDEIINISFVVSGSEGEQKLYLYLNGILSGAENLNNTNVFDMQNVSFIFNSGYCDFDLYKFRIYRTALTMPEVIHNYISDCRDVSLFDENQLTDENDDTILSYNELVKYNTEHPDDPSMPYAVWKINDSDHAGDDRLPFIKKGGTRICDVTFVNPWLDKALADGTITEEFYYNHSPSYTATGVTIDVQGTSSQGYPRRNYKTKFKSAKNNWVYTKGSLAGLTLNADHTLESGTKISKKWHMDNPYCATNKFTWKIDYMESSGSYNTGFANMMGNHLYNKHPLEDLYPEGNFSAYRTSVYGFPVLVFHEYADGTREYVGRYNLNLDKGSNEYFGFEEKLEQPYVTLTRDVTDEGTGVVSQEIYHPTIADVAECWELRDNQGTWCSWRFPTGYNDFSRTTNGQPDGDLEVLQHFEYRYNNQEDEIDAAIDKTTVLDDGTDVSGIIGSTGTAMNSWLRGKLSNLERLFIWLDSTDTSKATGDALETPVTYSVDRQVTDDNTIDYVVEPGGSILATFNNDTAEYRLQKFKAEFEKHLDRHYCTIYFIMTELLLCYDSRGKNMMMATFGPHEANGDYIWYPIFYDIDTQLGLNNVGALLWDYDEDATENQTFSTSTSVLWTNFYKMFMTDIRTIYATLRQNKLTYQTIEGAYTCNPNVFTDSYAMKGKRPIVAIGLDEYVKYIEPIRTGYYDTSGDIQTGESGDYLYACQGDRKLSRELFLINRLNYMDSKWQAGDYIVENAKQQIYMRVNVNATGTSDVYLDRESCDGVLPATARSEQTLADYPVPYLDARPEFTITPYLSQYVTTFVDDVRLTTTEAYSPAKYPSGMPSMVPDSLLSEYKKETKQQEINYLPAGDFLSSMGDLSSKYLDSIDIVHGKRLLDLTIGSDAPGYYNELAGNGSGQGSRWNFGDGIDSLNKKTLLKKVILTGLRNLTKPSDLRGSEKLQEYRALNTKVPYVRFANGCPLNTVHLPSATSELYLNGNKNLNKILRSAPQVVTVNNGVVTYNDHATYEGLYIEGITDYNFPQNYDFEHPVLGDNHALEYIEIADDALGYDSYEILRNAVVLKYNSNKANRGYLKVQMNNVHWSPYTVVPYGEAFDSTVTYYKLNDHSKYEVYNEGSAGWENGTLNEKIYTYDATANKQLITNLKMFDLFLEDMNAVEGTTYLNQYRNISKDSVKSYPTITGEIYIDNNDENEEPIIEDELTTKYGVAWPNLKITAAKVTESFLGKYIVLEDSGKESEYDVIRYDPALYEGQPITLTNKLNPSKGSTYDFVGWATDVEGNNLVFDEAGNMTSYGESYTFNAESRTVITLYAIFVDHRFAVTFINAVDNTSEVRNPNDAVIGTKYATYGNVVTAPDVLPVTMLDSSSLGLTDIYKFKGYTRLRTNTLVRTQTALRRALVDLTTMLLSEDVTLYACYMLQDVHDEPDSNDFFKFTSAAYSEYTLGVEGFVDPSYNISEGWQIDIKDGVELSGKVTLPTYYEGLPVISVGPTFATARNETSDSSSPSHWAPGRNITHVFWYKEHENDEIKVRQFLSYAFSNTKKQAESNITDSEPAKLRYVEMPRGLRVIDANAFQYCRSLDVANFELPDTLVRISNAAFVYAFDATTGADVFKLPSSLAFIGYTAFAYLNLAFLNTLQFGELGNGSNLTYLIETSRNYTTSDGIEYLLNVKNQVFTTNNGTYPANLTFYFNTEGQQMAWGRIKEANVQGQNDFTYYFSMIRDENFHIIDANHIEE